MSDVKPVLHHFYLDDKEYTTDKNFLTGLEIKNFASVPGNYQLFREETGDLPDKAISDGDTVSVARKEHFFAVPPATFG